MAKYLVFWVGVSSNHFVKKGSEDCEEKHGFNKQRYFFCVLGDRECGSNLLCRFQLTGDWLESTVGKL